MLLQVLQQHRETIATQAKQRVLSRAGRDHPDAAAQRAIDEVLEHIETVVRSGEGDLQRLAAASALRGRELFQEGTAIAQLVLGYGDVRQVISEVASDPDLGISAEELRLVYGYLDEATARAAMEYTRLQTLSLATKSIEQLGVFTHEVRNQLTPPRWHSKASGRLVVHRPGKPCPCSTAACATCASWWTARSRRCVSPPSLAEPSWFRSTICWRI